MKRIPSTIHWRNTISWCKYISKLWFLLRVKC